MKNNISAIDIMQPEQIKHNLIMARENYGMDIISLPKGFYLFNNMSKYPKYKDVHYAYAPDINMWILYDDAYYGKMMVFNAEKFRIDQCFDKYFQHQTLVDILNEKE